jgi:hypothetical protein
MLLLRQKKLKSMNFAALRQSEMSENTFSGGCQCGAVRFHTTELLDNAHICHCRMCQKAVGNYFAALVSTPKVKLSWTRGLPARFSSSEGVDRGFCQDCGTPLFYDAVHSLDVGLMIGALDRPADISPISQDSIESRVPWFGEILTVPDSGTSEQLDGQKRVADVAATNRQHPDHYTENWPL